MMAAALVLWCLAGVASAFMGLYVTYVNGPVGVFLLCMFFNFVITFCLVTGFWMEPWRKKPRP